MANTDLYDKFFGEPKDEEVVEEIASESTSLYDKYFGEPAKAGEVESTPASKEITPVIEPPDPVISDPAKVEAEPEGKKSFFENALDMTESNLGIGEMDTSETRPSLFAPKPQEARWIKPEGPKPESFIKGTTKSLYNQLGLETADYSMEQESFDKTPEEPLDVASEKAGQISSGALTIMGDTVDALGTMAKDPLGVAGGAARVGAILNPLTIGVAMAAGTGAFVGEAITQVAFYDLPEWSEYVEERPYTVADPVAYMFSGFNLEEMYDRFIEGFSLALEGAHAVTEPSIEMLTGPERKASELTQETAFAPFTAGQMPFQALAGHEWFADSPNLRGVLKVTGDIVGAAGMGLAMHGGKKTPMDSIPEGYVDRLPTNVREVRDISKEIETLIAKKSEVEKIPDEVVRRAEEAALEIQKKQLELRAQEAAKSISIDATIREELLRNSERIALEKAMPVANSGLKKATEAQVRNVMERLPEGAEIEAEFTAKKSGNRYVKSEGKWYDKDGKVVTNGWIIKSAEKGKKGVEKVEVETPAEVKVEKKPVEEIKVEEKPAEKPLIEEPVVEEGKVHISKVSEPVPDTVKGEQSPFFQDRKTAIVQKKIFDEKRKIEDVEIFTQKLISEANQWFHGLGEVKIEDVKAGLDKLVQKADDYNHHFISTRDYAIWRETVTDAAAWVRTLDRYEKNQSGSSSPRKPGKGKDGGPVFGMTIIPGIHPATFPKVIIETLSKVVKDLKVDEVLDIFGGIGKIGKIKDHGYKGKVITNEIEPKWGGKDTVELNKSNGVDQVMIGDSRNLNLPDNSIQAIVTSPTYGNLMGLKSPSKRDSYTALAGGKLKEGNTGGDVWGPKYETLHKEIYEEAYRVVKPGGYFVLNMKDKPVTAKDTKNRWIPKKGSTVKVIDQVMRATDWHIEVLKDLGFEHIKTIRIKEPKRISSTQRLSKSVGYEDIVVMKKPKASTSNTFGMMILPVDKMPKAVADILKGSKALVKSFAAAKVLGVPYGEIYRNKKIYNETGYWLGKDGKWRHILKSNKMKINAERLKTGKNLLLRDVLDYPELYKEVPELEYVRIKLDRNMKGHGNYSHIDNTITVKNPHDMYVVLHETSHALSKVKKTFQGSTSDIEYREIVTRHFKTLEKLAKTDVGRENIATLRKWLDTTGNVELASKIAYRDVLKSAKEYGLEEKNLRIFEAPIRSYDRYLQVPGEMEARLAERLSKMTEAQLENIPPWEVLERMLKEEQLNWENTESYNSAMHKLIYNRLKEVASKVSDLKEKDRIMRERKALGEQILIDNFGEGWKDHLDTLANYLEAIGETEAYKVAKFPLGKPKIETYGSVRYSPRASYKLYSGVPIPEMKEVFEMCKDVSDYFTKARHHKRLNFFGKTKELKREGVRAFINTSGNLRQDLLKIGDAGWELLQLHTLAKNANSKAVGVFDRMFKVLDSGLSKRERDIRDNLIFTNRVLDIASYKTPKQFKILQEIDPMKFAMYKEGFEFFEGLSPKKAARVRESANDYFSFMKEALADMYDSGLITEEKFNSLVTHNYSRMELADNIDEFRYVTVGGKQVKVYDSGIQALKSGEATDMFETSSRILAFETLSRAYGRIEKNKLNKRIAQLAIDNPDNPIARVKMEIKSVVNGKEVVKKTKIPKGWKGVDYFENGERKTVHLHPEIYKEWVMSAEHMSNQFAKFLELASGTRVLKTFATGIEASFALVNMPWDVMRTMWSARRFKDGKWEAEYNPVLPIGIGQELYGIGRVSMDVIRRKGIYQEWVNEAAKPNFLAIQGRMFRKGKYLGGPADKINNTLGYIGETSEALTRVGIYDHHIRKVANERGISYEEARKDPGIRREAAFISLDNTNFGEYGYIMGGLNNVSPYLTAGVVGNRAFYRAFKPNEGTAAVSAFKLAQFSAAIIGTYAVAKELSPKTMDQLQDDPNMERVLAIPLGDAFGFEDQYGQMRYPYFKIPIPHEMRVFKAASEGAYDKVVGNPVNVERIVEAGKNINPVGSPLPPTVEAYLGYVSNKDFWRNEDIVNQKFPYPLSKDEGYPNQTSNVFKDVAEKTGLSGPRSEHFVESLLTSNSMWLWMGGKAYEKLLMDLPKDQYKYHWAEIASKTPGLSRYIGITNPYNKSRKNIDQEKLLAEHKRHVENTMLDSVVEGYLYRGTDTKKDVIDYIRQFKDEKVQKRLYDRFAFQQALNKTQDMDLMNNRTFWLRMQNITDAEARAKVFVNEVENSLPERAEELKRELGLINSMENAKVPNFRVVSEPFIQAYVQIMSEKIKAEREAEGE